MTLALVIDDHPIIVEVCVGVLRTAGIDEIVGARTVSCGYRTSLRLRPDLIVADLTLQGDDLRGLALIERLKKKDRQARILVFTMHDDPTIVSRALRAGALGYVLKDAPSDELAQACIRTLGGQPHLSHDLAMKVALLRTRYPNSGKHLTMLTDREGEILALLGKGYGYDELSRSLGIKEKTVVNAIALLRAKLEIGSFADLLHYAKQRRDL